MVAGKRVWSCWWQLWFGSTSPLSRMGGMLQLPCALWWELHKWSLNWTLKAGSHWVSPGQSVSLSEAYFCCLFCALSEQMEEACGKLAHMVVSIDNSSFFLIFALHPSSYIYGAFKLKNCLFPSIVCTQNCGTLSSKPSGCSYSSSAFQKVLILSWWLDSISPIHNTCIDIFSMGLWPSTERVFSGKFAEIWGKCQLFLLIKLNTEKIQN